MPKSDGLSRMRGGRLNPLPPDEMYVRVLLVSPVLEAGIMFAGNSLSDSLPMSCGETERFRDRTNTTSGRGACVKTSPVSNFEEYKEPLSVTRIISFEFDSETQTSVGSDYF